jgi:error-prone DNA polymerase
MTGDYAELQVTSNFSFLDGGSHPAELVETAQALGHAAVAITDRNTLAGIVRAHVAAQQYGIRLVIGCRLDFVDRPSLLCFPSDRAAYGRLSQLLTLGKRRAPKGECRLYDADLADAMAGQALVILPPDRPDERFAQQVRDDARRYAGCYFIAAQYRYRGDDAARLNALDRLAGAAGVRLLATNDVLYHRPERRALQDVLACIRLKCTIEAAGRRLEVHAERHLKNPAEMARLFRPWPDALAAIGDLIERSRFGLDQVEYEYPDEVPDGRDPFDELVVRVERGVAERYGANPPDKIVKLIAHELSLIAERKFAPFFLTVHDITRFARQRQILCQGRGSAANSVVCYVLGITAVDPNKFDLLFERFISTARNEPPDIDVDFEHERREEVIQHIYRHYTRERAAIAATVIRYRMRSAVREVGKAMGLSVDSVALLARSIWGWSRAALTEAQVREAGLDPSDPLLARVLDLAEALVGFPRHLSQHVGGFVITRGPLAELVPICNAAMAERTHIEWDKDDIDALKILKVDVLALGMLTCLEKSFALIETHFGGPRYTLYSVPQDVAGVYEMIQRADTIGVFQIESRAQMSMLPRLKPERFYDLVIEVAIVRPGPIQGGMVHPYLRRRESREPVQYPSPALEKVLAKTLGVPLFQEQAMQIAIVGAGFSPDEADGLRRAMATFKEPGHVVKFRDRFIEGMESNGLDRDFAERCFKQIEGFGTYGFPESHAVSFAFLAYDSAWVKWCHPDVFACALLNSLPMGFYEPPQIVRDAREHGVEVRPIDVNYSDWDCTLERDDAASTRLALRLGFRLVKGLAEAAMRRLVERRGAGYRLAGELHRRGGLDRAVLEDLARADAFRSLGLDRRQALWAVKGLDDNDLPLFAVPETRPSREPAVTLPKMGLKEHVFEDYRMARLSLKQHPVAFLRKDLAERKILPCAALAQTRDGRRVAVAGLVLVRQRPGTAKGIIFMTIEDETGTANIVIWKRLFDENRRTVMTSRLIAVSGLVQKEGIVIHVVAERLTDLSADLRLDGEDLPLSHSRGDEAIHSGQDHRVLEQKSRDFH